MYPFVDGDLEEDTEDTPKPDEDREVPQPEED